MTGHFYPTVQQSPTETLLSKFNQKGLACVSLYSSFLLFSHPSYCPYGLHLYNPLSPCAFVNHRLTFTESPIHTHMQPAIELLRKHQVSSCHLETEVSRCPWVMLWKPHGCQKKYQISFIHTIYFLNELFLVSPSPDVLGGRPSRGEVPCPVAGRFSACSVSGWPSLLQCARALLVRTSGPCWGTNPAPVPGPGKPLTAGVEHMPATPLPDALWPGDITNRWLLSELQRHKGCVKTIWFKVISQRLSNKRMCYAHYNFRACFGTWNNFTVEPFQLFFIKMLIKYIWKCRWGFSLWSRWGQERWLCQMRVILQLRALPCWKKGWLSSLHTYILRSDPQLAFTGLRAIGFRPSCVKYFPLKVYKTG